MRCRPSCATPSSIRGRRRFNRLAARYRQTDLVARLSAPRGKQSLSNWLRKAAHLSPVGIGLLQEAALASGVSLSSLSPAEPAGLINAVPVRLNGVAPIARAISSAGGICVRRTRRRLHAPPPARRFRGRRDAGLGSPDRRLSAAGLVRDRRRGGQGRAEVARQPSLATSGSRPIGASTAISKPAPCRPAFSSRCVDRPPCEREHLP